MAVPIVGGVGQMLSRRQPDIVVPLFTAPYTISTNASNPMTSCIDPLLVQTFDAPSSFGNQVNKAVYNTLSPFALGVTNIAPNAPFTSSAGRAHLLYGDVVFSRPAPLVSTTQMAFTVPLIAGVTINIPSASSTINCGSDNLGTVENAYGIFAKFAQGTNVSVPWCGGISDVNVYGMVLDQMLFGQNLPENHQLTGYDTSHIGNVWGQCLSQGVVLADFDTNTNWMLNNKASAPMYVGQMYLDAPLLGDVFPLVNKLTFDNAAINSILNSATIIHMQATSVGFIVVSTTQFYSGQRATVALISKDGSQYAMIKFAPQSALAASLVTQSNQPGCFMDRNNVFYATRQTTSQVFNSYSLDIPWSGVTLPAFQNPPFVLPELCGCTPYNQARK